MFQVQRVALDTEAPKGQMVVLVTMVPSVTQETLGHGASLEIKVSQSHDWILHVWPECLVVSVH